MQTKQAIHKIAQVAPLLLGQQPLLLGTGILFGLTILVWLSQFIATFGSSLPVLTGLSLGIAIAFELAWSQPKQSQLTSRFFSAPVIWLIIAVWIVAFPWLLSWGTSFISVFPIADLSLMFVQTCIAFVATLLIFFLPFFMMTRYLCQSSQCQNNNLSFSTILAGISCGLLMGATGLAPLWGLQVSGIVIATIAALLAIVNFTKPTFLFKKLPAAHINGSSSIVFPSHKEQGIAILLLGMMFALLLRVASQLHVGTFVVSVFYWSVLLTGGAVGFWWRVRSAKKSTSRTYPVSSLILFASAWSVVILFLFPQLTNVTLQAKAAVSSVWFNQMSQFLTICFIVLPLGFVWGSLAVQATVYQQGKSAGQQKNPVVCWSAPHVLAFVTGVVIAAWGIVTSRNAAGWLIAVTLLSLLFPCWHFASSVLKKELRNSTCMRYVLLVTSICLVLSGPFIVSRYQPARTSRLLFRSDISIALKQGFDFRLLSSTDEGRLIDQIEGTQGTYTLWQHRGGQVQIRENGIPMISVSTNPQICPQSTTKVMQVLLPWVLHENPQTILLLGLQGGTAVQASLTLPLKAVVCIEEEKALQKIVQRNIWSRSGYNPFQDERFQMLSVNPVLAVHSQRQKYDLIISSPNQTSLMQSTPCLTEEFYSNAAGQLTEEGIFCQQFERRDYGPLPLLSLLKTMQLVFDDVMVIETGTAEMVLLGTRCEKGLKRHDLVSRLQSPAAREVLGQLGWDWSLPLNLRAFDDEAVTQLLNKADAPANNVANNWLTFQLPIEVMRWSKGVSKSTEFEKLVAGNAGKLLKWSVKESEEQDVLDRLADVAGGQKLMANYPDNWYAYRKVVKKQIQNNPRPTIQLVHGKGLKKRMHPILQRRLNFFTTLGKAKKKQNPTVDDLAEIARFEYPYDPLMSPFFHQEMVEFMPRIKDVDPQIELSYRLHTIYYGHAADRSIHNILDTIHFMIKQPGLLDHRTTQIELEGLLQLLKGRWELRGRVPPLESEVVLNDIKKTLRATELAFVEIERLEKEQPAPHTPNSNISKSFQQQLKNICDGGDPVQRVEEIRNWQLRKTYITRTLVRPLRTYRDRLLPHHQAEQRKKRLKEKVRRANAM